MAIEIPGLPPTILPQGVQLSGGHGSPSVSSLPCRSTIYNFESRISWKKVLDQANTSTINIHDPDLSVIRKQKAVTVGMHRW
jgi:hypothetical protein